LGIRLTPPLLYYLVPAWWYVGCLLQLYLVFPLLLPALRRLGSGRFLAVAAGGALVVRAAGLALTEIDLDWCARGGIALTRAPQPAWHLPPPWWTTLPARAAGCARRGRSSRLPRRISSAPRSRSRSRACRSRRFSSPGARS